MAFRPSPSPAVPGSDDPLAGRAAALVNPASGLANDYLNVFNEIVMMIDLLPEMPDLAETIATWTPVTYRSYFQQSTLSGREQALHAYATLDPLFRRTFNRQVADLSRCARAIRATVLEASGEAHGASTGALIDACGSGATRLRRRLDSVTDLVNRGPKARRRSRLRRAA